YFQRECLLWKEADKAMNWSAYDRLRFDILSSDAPAILGVKVRDKLLVVKNPKGKSGSLPVGLRTAVSVFKIPAGKQVTCEYPLAAMTSIAEMDLGNIHWMHIRLNGFEGKTAIYLDNIRLLTKDAKEELTYDLVKTESEVRPFSRKVWDKNPPPRDRTKFKRESGPVEKLGPVTVFDGPGNHACAAGHLGGNGSTYVQSLRRGSVAFDNQRLLLIFGGGGPGKDSRVVTWGGAGEGSTIWATASFDGGKTWGGLKPGETSPVCLPDWYWRSTASSDSSGDLYYIGTENCDSYVEGHDVFFRRLVFTGEGWEPDRMTIIDQNEYKCPGPARALRLASGRIWAAWTDGWNGPWVKSSDDDGLTWMPCKDASKPAPRPFYEPKLEDIQKPDPPKPPAEILLWPGTPSAGPLLVPYKGHVAAFAYDGSQWAAHDGKVWGAIEKVPWKGGKGGQAGEAVLGEDNVFLARVEGDKLLAIRLRGGEWQGPEELDSGKVSKPILSASGEAVFCFYSKTEEEGGAAVYNIYSRRWKGGKWEPAEKVASEKDESNDLGAPTVSPPDYAAIFWDQLGGKGIKTTWIKFARVPNK
ncbi:MAG: sialidase family protein, partial [Planctomycetota bacterium]